MRWIPHGERVPQQVAWRDKPASELDSELRLFWPIVITYVTFQPVSEVTACKIVQIGPAQVSATVAYFPITYILSDILTEVYGYARARRALWLMMCASITAGLLYIN